MGFARPGADGYLNIIDFERRAVRRARPFFNSAGNGTTRLTTALLVLLAAAAFALALAPLAGCGGEAASPTSAAPSYTGPPKVVFTPAAGGPEASLNVELARTAQEKSTGLMNRSQLTPDSGMIFLWDSPVRNSFWMKDTLIPLSIAFIAADGSIVDIQEMEAMTTTMHAPPKPYIWAVEANRGWYAAHEIKPGDRAELFYSGSS
jgi:uncharacterized membrane protein (UPF0127 family)